jgi:uncharacterized protein (DUF433 family)
MAAKRNDIDPNDIIDSYRSGSSINAIQKAYRIHPRRIRSILANAGITTLTQHEAASMPRRNDIDTTLVVSAYEAGQSLRKLATTYHTDTDVIKRILTGAGINTRGMKEAKAAQFHLRGEHGSRWIKIDIDTLTSEYLSGASASDLASEYGVSKDTIERRLRPLGIMRTPGRSTNREKIAKTRQQDIVGIGRFEDEIFESLSARGYNPVRQHAVGSRNIDVSIHPIAVEIWFSSLRPDNDAYCRERIVDLADAGWNVAYVFISRHTHTLNERVMDQLISWHEVFKTNPTSRREYRVIRGTGELLAAGRVYPEYRPIVPTPIDGLNPI